MELLRRNARQVKVGNLMMGGDTPILVQSMCNTDTHDAEATYRQVVALRDAGCDIVRLAVPDLAAAEIFRYLKAKKVGVPLVADIHFDYRIAIASVGAGADKIRFNPGNIGAEEYIVKLVDACRAASVPIRIGVNSGSLEKHILRKYGAPTAEALAESALYHAAFLERLDFRDIVISVKASDVRSMILANRILAEKTDYPLHLGVTEAGGVTAGTVKSAVGIGSLLSMGIGDTIRVSLTADPVEEIRAARAILSALGMNKVPEMDIVSCPTCGRTKIDLVSLLSEFEAAVDREGLRKKPVKVAFMGCVVNGPGEAREADIGIAGGKGEAVLFRHGEILRKISSDAIVASLIDEIKRL